MLGRKIQLINYDPQSNIQLYTQYATEAATKEKVAVVHGGITSASREAIRPLLKRYNTLYFYNTLYEGGVCDRNIFCTGSTPAQTVEKLVPYVQKKWGKKIYTIAADYNYGQITAKWVKKYAQDNGGEVVQTDFFPLDVTDFGPTIKKIQAAKPDLVMSALVGAAHISFYRQWAAAGMNKQIPLASTTFGNEIVITSPEEHNGFIVAFAYLEGIDTPANKKFVEIVHDKYEHPAHDRARHHDLSRRASVGGRGEEGGQRRPHEGDRGARGRTPRSTGRPARPRSTRRRTTRSSTSISARPRTRSSRCSRSSRSRSRPTPQAVCDLKKHPNENKQYVIDVKT